MHVCVYILFLLFSAPLNLNPLLYKANSLYSLHTPSSINNNSWNVSSQLSQTVVIDLGSEKFGTLRTHLPIMYVLVKQEKWVLLSGCHLLIGCSKIWLHLACCFSLFALQACVCINIHFNAGRCVHFSARYYIQINKVYACVYRSCLCVIFTLGREMEG